MILFHNFQNITPETNDSDYLWSGFVGAVLTEKRGAGGREIFFHYTLIPVLNHVNYCLFVTTKINLK